MDVRMHTVLWGLGLALLFQGCNAYMHQPMSPQAARIGEPTPFNKTLRGLPKPPRRVVAAVYKFRDQTGQYRPQEVGAGFSTVVTQGATNILIKAMEDSGWFKPIERENVNNLLNERKIIRSTRAQFEQSQGPQPILPPLLFAGIILEGGIISYDANILTGGAGLRYFGAGGSGQYRQDRVTVYLRVISTQNGEILKTVYTSKTILSQSIDGGIFRFVSFQRLLEAETGFTYNEPSDLAVTEAIEKALYTLIVEGMQEGLWDAAPNQQKEKKETLKAFQAEREAMADTDLFGRQVYYHSNKPALRVGGSGLYYRGDIGGSQISFGADVGLEIPITPSFAIHPQAGFGRLATESLYSENIIFADVNLQWRMLPLNRFTPIVYGGAGVVIDQDGQSEETPRRNYFKVQGGGGFEYFLSPTVAVDVLFDYSYLLDDNIDRTPNGRFNDTFYRGRIGLKFFFGNDNNNK